MSLTSKSPKAVLLTALKIAKSSLPAHRHRNSPKKFTQHQLFACLVLKNFLKTDYRGLVEYLADCDSLSDAIELVCVAHYTTFQKAARRLLVNKTAQKLLDETVRVQMQRKRRVKEAAIDSTGLSATNASPYFVKRRATKQSPWKTITYRRYPKLGVVTNVANHFILAFESGKGPYPDVGEFRGLIQQAAARVKLKTVLADAGYDSEANHQFAREELALRTVIPPKHRRPSDKPAKGRYRRLMQTRFDEQSYRKRAQVETVMSTIKRPQSLGRQFGDNHKVKLGRKRSKTNGVKLGGMASGWWVSPGAPSRCSFPQVLLPGAPSRCSFPQVLLTRGMSFGRCLKRPPFVLVTPAQSLGMQSVKKKHQVNLWNQSCINRYAPRERKFVRVEVLKR